MIRLIAAIDDKRGLAKNGALPWRIPEDIAYFANQTKSHGGNFLAGSTTFKTFKHALKERRNFILTHKTEPIEGAELVHDLDSFLKEFNEDLWIIGGAKVFEEVIDQADELYLTFVKGDFQCDQFFPAYKDKYELVEESPEHQQNGFLYRFSIYRRKN